jgi:hypothetical protein
MTKSERKKLYKLIEQWARCECIARFSPFGWPDCGDYFNEKLQKEDEIRELMFGTGDLLLLGKRWGIRGCVDPSKKHKKKKKIIRGKHS